MSLSILWLGGLLHGLWDSKTENFLMTGSITEMESWKDYLERADQLQLNREHFKELREKYIDQLMKGGATQDTATSFIKEKMPYLWD